MVKLRAAYSPAFRCGYLPEREERCLFIPAQPDLNAATYGELLARGFRRSGEQVYAPRCSGCQACLPLRVPVAEFRPSSSQKRALKRSQHWHSRVVTQADWLAYWPLFDAFVTLRHGDGGMYPPQFNAMVSFLDCSWLPPRALEIYCAETLVAVLIIDTTASALSAVYTFFSPDFSEFSPGVVAVLKLIELAQQEQRSHVYLGFQIDDCRKMSYKRNFRPYEILHGDCWLRPVATP